MKRKKFRFGKYLFAVRGTVINLTSRQNPTVVVNNIDAMGVTPPFLNFSGGQGRAFTGRLGRAVATNFVVASEHAGAPSPAPGLRSARP